MDVYSALCSDLQVQALIIVGADPHQLEIVDNAYKIRHYVANFFGSAGTFLLYCDNFSGNSSSSKHTRTALWTDARYEVAATQALDSNTQLFISKEFDWHAQILWLANTHNDYSAHNDLCIHISAAQVSIANFEEIQSHITEIAKEFSFAISMSPLDYSALFESVRKYYPKITKLAKLNCSPPISKTSSTILEGLPYLDSTIWNLGEMQLHYDNTYNSTTTMAVGNLSSRSTETVVHRFAQLTEFLSSIDASTYFSANIHELAWLSQLRSNSLPYLMLFPCIFAFNNDTQTLKLWLPDNLQNAHSIDCIHKLEVQTNLQIILNNYKDLLGNPSKIIAEALGNVSVAKHSKPIVYDPSCVPYSLFSNKFRAITSPIKHWKTIRTAQEIEDTRMACLFDSIALMEAITKIAERTEKRNALTEQDGCDIILSCRQVQAMFLQESFRTIFATGENAAFPHYSGTSPSPYIDVRAPLLIDSGAHYVYGTTDLTRMYHFDSIINAVPAHPLFIEDYNAVLKTHIALAIHRVPLSRASKYPLGQDIDRIVRATLAKLNRSYGHGTGHSIGYCTDVHEGITHLSQTCTEEIIPNLLLSNEPGYYRIGKWGVRIENMVVTAVNSQNELVFDTISYFPFQNSLIDSSLFSEEELAWLYKYQDDCSTLLAPHLSPKAKTMLTTLLTHNY